ncbi:antirestriction protein, partial [Escherichia coli]
MQYAKSVTLNVEECDRLSFLPYLFGRDFLYAEASVYALAKKMMPEYQGGFWHFIRLPEGKRATLARRPLPFPFVMCP